MKILRAAKSLFLALALLAMCGDSLPAQWVDSLPSVSFATVNFSRDTALQRYALQDSLVRPPQRRFEWAVVGAVVLGTSAWCSWDFFCGGATDAPRASFSLTAAALGGLVGWLFGETLFGGISPTIDGNQSNQESSTHNAAVPRCTRATTRFCYRPQETFFR